MTRSVYFEIDEVATGVSLSTGTSFTTKRIISRKCEHSCLSIGLKSDGLIPSREI